MTRWHGGKLRGTGTTLTLLAAVASVGVTIATERPASAQDIERVLAGIRLNSKSSSVLAKYGNPNEVVIGDIGFRGTGPSGQAGGATGGEGVPADSGASASGGLPGFGGGGGGGGRSPMSTRGGSGPPSGALGAPSGPPGGYTPPGGGGFGGSPGGGFGAPSGGGFGAPAGDGETGGFGGSGGFGGGGATGSTSGAVGPFGQSVSTLARQQEVTWIYNRKVNNNLVTYNFLIGPNGNVVQIMVTGYSGGNSKTKRNVGLGSTYKDIVKAYGYPEEHAIVGRTLVASYRTRAHVSFQFLPETPQSNPLATGNKCIAVTIATVE